MQERPNITLYCTELSKEIPSFLENNFLRKNLYTGYVPKCLKKGIKFDLIYIIAIDYCMSNSEWVNLLKNLNDYLTKDGIIIIHAPYNNYSFSLYDHIKQFIITVKIFVNHFLLKKFVQFWGWSRSIEDQIMLCKKAGLHDIDLETYDDLLFLTYFKAGHDRKNKELRIYYLRMAHNMSGEIVWFWGAGAAYEYYKQNFTCLCPQGMILSQEFVGSTPSVDGIPVISPQAAATQHENIPIIIFTRVQHQDAILKEVWKYFGSKANIHPVILY